MSPDLPAVRRLSREFAQDVVVRADGAEDLATAEERFLATRPIYEAMVAEGFLRRCIPAGAGGDGDGLRATATIFEEFFSANASVSLTLASTVLGLSPIILAGTDEQRARLLRPFLSKAGAPLAAFCATEPGGSANAASSLPGEGVRTTGARDGGDWVVQGRKSWVSSATGWHREGADVLCVLCRTDAGRPAASGMSIIAIERPASGLEFEGAVQTIGLRAHLLPQFRLDGVRAPAGNLLGPEGDGLAVGAASFTGGAALVGIYATALMRSAFDFALAFAKAEKRGGPVTIIEHDAVGYALVDAKTAIEAVRSLTWRACDAIDDRSGAASELAIQAKIFGSDTAVRVITSLMGVVGVESYDDQGPLARLLKDALALPVFAGGNVGVRRRQLHALMKRDDYDPLFAGDPGSG